VKKPLVLAFGLLAVCAAAVFAGGEKETAPETEAAKGEDAGQKGIWIKEPELVGFPQTGDSELPGYVQGILTSNFVNYSGMTVNNQTDTRDYSLEGRIQRHSSTQYTIRLAIQKMDSLDFIATSDASANSLSDLKFGEPLNKATKDLLANTKLGVNLTAEAKRELDKPLNTKWAEGQAAIVKAGAASSTSIKREQNANVAEDLGQNLTKAGLQLSESVKEKFSLPEFNAPAEFTAPKFTPPAIRTFSTSATVERIRADVDRYRENQAANRAAIEEQQQHILGQRKDILDQWQNFLDQVETRRQLLRDEDQKLLQVQAKLEAELREGEALYRASLPFRILYDPNPKVTINLERGMANMRFQIAAEPTSLKVLKVRLDNLVELNKSFAKVSKAYGDVNTAMTAQFVRVEAAMDAVKNAMDRANAAGSTLGEGYKVAPLSADWTVPRGNTEYGAKLTTSWTVDYPRTFALTVSLLIVKGEDDIEVIESTSLTLINDISWNGPLEPEPASLWASFNNVKVERLGTHGVPVARVETVNDVDAETAAIEGYIEIIPDGGRTAAVGRQIAERESWRSYWSEPKRLNSLGAAIGTAGVTPAFMVSPKLTFSLFSGSFFEAGSDFGLVHGEGDVKDVEYFSIAPYLHANLFARTDGGGFGAYIGIGGGASFSRYTYPSESRIDPVTVFTPVFDFNTGFLIGISSRSVIDLRWTIKTNFNGLNHRFALGYMCRFGYFAPRFGGKPANLTSGR
jgi:hypothetical protein